MTSYSRYVIDIWFLHHCAHRVLNASIGKLIVTVLVPYYLKVKVRAV